MRRPAQIAIASATFLIVLGIPFWGVRFISVDASVLPTTTSARQVADALKQQFPPNRTAPLDVVVGAPAGSQQVKALAARIERLPNVSAVSPAQPASSFDSLLLVAPRQGPLTHASQRLVHDVRAIHEPFYVGVAGDTAAQVDLEHSLAAHLPLVLAIVIVSTLVILFLMTGSVVLPIKAVLMNALTLTAVFGILVLIFQDGNLESLLGFHSEGALGHAADPAVCGGLRTGDRLRRSAVVANQGGLRRRREQLRRRRDRPRAHRTPRHLGRRVVRRSDRRVRGVGDRVHQGARGRRGAGGADRRFDHPRAARPFADGVAGLAQLVGAAAPAAAV
jgi:hypothetical protein